MEENGYDLIGAVPVRKGTAAPDPFTSHDGGGLEAAGEHDPHRHDSVGVCKHH